MYMFHNVMWKYVLRNTEAEWGAKRVSKATKTKMMLRLQHDFTPSATLHRVPQFRIASPRHSPFCTLSVYLLFTVLGTLDVKCFEFSLRLHTPLSRAAQFTIALLLYVVLVLGRFFSKKSSFKLVFVIFFVYLSHKCILRCARVSFVTLQRGRRAIARWSPISPNISPTYTQHS